MTIVIIALFAALVLAGYDLAGRARAAAVPVCLAPNRCEYRGRCVCRD
jgi:hypothetical protein